MVDKVQGKLSVLNLSTTSDKLFFGNCGHGIARYDKVKYDIFLKLNKKMQNFFWRPEEVDMSQEKRSYESMPENEQHIFTSNLKRQILLDSIQGRAPGLVFLPHVTDSSLENCINTWGFFESIHSESYTHIIKAIYPNPSLVYDEMVNIQEIADCSVAISQAYDNFIEYPTKENLYLALVAANALEAIRFYVSFACTFSFLERGLVEGSAKIIKLIARDEAEHLSLVQHILKILPKDDPDFVDIIKDQKEAALNIFRQAAEQEKAWAKFLFKDKAILGLNEKILCDYVDYLFLRRAKAIGLSADVSYSGSNPIPWINKHLTSSNSQVAPQEVEISSYLSATSIKNDINDKNFANLWNNTEDI